MSTPDTSRTPGEWRTWLKTVAESSLGERLPAVHEPSGRPTIEYARALLEELDTTDSQARPESELIAEIREFARWVLAEQRRIRRFIVSDPSSEAWSQRYNPGGWNAPRRADSAFEEEDESTEQNPEESIRSSGPHPMWDDFLDGLPH